MAVLAKSSSVAISVLLITTLHAEARPSHRPHRESPGPCGQLHVAVMGKASAPAQGPKSDFKDDTYSLDTGQGPTGELIHEQYGEPRFGAYSVESIDTYCSSQLPFIPSDPYPFELKVITTSDEGSGVGPNAYADSTFSTQWIFFRRLSPPTQGRRWQVSVTGTIDAENTTPTCSVQVNEEKRDAPLGVVAQYFHGIRQSLVFVFQCAQPSAGIFPHGDQPTYRRVNVKYDVTIAIYGEDR